MFSVCPLREINQAIADMRRDETIKPVLIMPES